MYRWYLVNGADSGVAIHVPAGEAELCGDILHFHLSGGAHTARARVCVTVHCN